MRTKEIPSLTLAVPCYNEEEILENTASKLEELLLELIASQRIKKGSSLLFINDGSTDKTLEILHHIKQKQQKDDLNIQILNLEQNKGHQEALLAGLAFNSSDVMISIDADLQDDINVIPEMLKGWQEGYEIVLGARNDRVTDRPFKHFTASFFYWVMKYVGSKQVPQHADFRLLSRHAAKILVQKATRPLYLRGSVVQMGIPWKVVFYQRKKREGGVSKYTLRKMLFLAFSGLISHFKS
ncbi:glycosyltransferase family 2 protein [Acetobacteraceae bacterium]|nr:glycosyltransferase family 2 protein [Acetobacteraceae bacterium]